MPFSVSYQRVAHLTIVGCATWLLGACQTRYDELPTYSQERQLLQVVVETPAGTNHELQYSAADNSFVPVKHAGTEHVVGFLPYPANTGFIPATHLPATPKHPKGRPQPALVLAESMPSGTVLEVLPIGLLMLDNAGEIEFVVVTVPARPSQRVLPVTTWQELTTQHPAARDILRLWYQHSAPAGQVRVAGWRDEHAAEHQVRKALRNNVLH
jgi:inorganic pyrophosphatase